VSGTVQASMALQIAVLHMTTFVVPDYFKHKTVFPFYMLRDENPVITISVNATPRLLCQMFCGTN
jgi:hypothetical protein